MAQYLKPKSRYLGNNDDVFEVTMISDADGNIISDFGGVVEGGAPSGADIITRINIASGNIAGYSYVNKFGRRNISAHATNYYSITSQGEYVFPTSPDTASVSSTNDGQDNGGTVLVTGLDGNFNEVEETITIGSSGSQQFLRVHRAQVVTAGSGNDENKGDITIEVDGEDVAYIPSTFGQTLQCEYTVPAGKTAYIYQIDCSVDEKEKPIHIRLMSRDAVLTNASWQTKAFIVFENTYVAHNQTVPITIPEKTDIVLYGNSTSGALEVSGGFDLVLVDND